jgi:ribosome maturation protein Sdo1
MELRDRAKGGSSKMKIINLGDNTFIHLESIKTRGGFKHEATRVKNGLEDFKVKINYINRTWESYEFKSVITKLFEKLKLDDNTKELYFNIIARGGF